MPFRKLLFIIVFVYPLICLSQPEAGFTANGKAIKYGDTIRVCNGSSITYTSTALNVNTISWTFSNGSPQTSFSFSESVSYTTVGLGKAVQVVTDVNNKTDSLVAFVKVADKDPNLTSSFTYSPNTNNQCGSVPYQFTGTSKGNELTYSWNFGDDSTSIKQNPVHQFNSAVGGSGTQTFTVALTVTDINGCSDVSQQTITVLKIPDASLINLDGNSTYNTMLFNGLNTFQYCMDSSSYKFIFVNNSTTDAINTKYVFDWGDNSGTRTLDNNWKMNDTVAHTYTLGLHVLTLSVTNSSTGCTAIKKYNVFLGSSPGGAFGPQNNQREFCIGDTGYFNISGYQENPPGTIYQLHFDDGSVDSIYQQPPPSTVTHVFASSSCINPNGYFTAYFYISNPCLTTQIINPNFYVSGKPSAGMYINPDTVACLNSTVSITNTSDFGSVSTTSGCTNTGLQVWKIYPSNGYIITSGDTGNISGNIRDYSNWKSGTSSLNIKFTAAGIYKIKLYITNEKCGLDSIEETICARENPQALFKITGTLKCTSDTLMLQNNSAAASCAGDVYEWTINAMDDEGCGTGAQPVFVNGADANTKSPGVWFKEPGRYTINLRTIAVSTGNTCFAESSDTVTIKGKPKVSINPVADVCLGNSINPTAVVTNCYSVVAPSYKWTFTNGNPAASDQLVPGSVMYSTTGQQPLQLNVTNECGTSSDNTTVNVIAKPAANAGPDKELCSGTSVVIGTAAIAGYNYSWLPAAGLSDAGIAAPVASLVYNGTNSDTTYKYVVTATVGGNCFSADSVFIKVKKAPVVTVTPAVASFCKGEAVTLIAKGAETYNWSPPVYLNTSTNDTVIAKPDTTVTYTVSGISSNGCSDSSTITVALNPDAKAVFSEKFISGCAPFDLDTIINAAAYPDRNLTYNWYANNVLIESNSTGKVPSYKILKAGDSVLIRLVTTSKSGCKSDSISQKFYSGIGVNAAFKINTGEGCEPLVVTVTNTSSNINSTNFNWNFGNGETTANASPDTIIYHTGTTHNDTTYYITLLASNGCASQTLKDSVHIKALPVARFGVNNTFGCSPDTLVITNTSAGNPYLYYWDFGDGTYDTTNNRFVLSHVYTTGVSDTLNVVLTAINSCGKNSLPLNIVIEPNSIRAQVNVFGNDLFGCVPHTVIFNNNTTGATTALWNFGDNSYELLDASQVTIEHVYTDTGTFNITTNFTNGCSDTAISKQVIVYPHPHAAFTTDKLIYCFGDSVHLDITAASGNINRLYWGDDNLFFSPPPVSHYYNTLGNYEIKLYADRVSAYGTVCSDSSVTSIKIAERPVTKVTSANDIDCFVNSSGLSALGGIAYVWSPAGSLNNNTISNPVAKPLVTTNYTVNITGRSGCVVTDSVLVKVNFSSGGNAYLIPSAFTPNGDGLNDCIKIKYPGYIQEMDLRIYNRWGQMLFHANNPSQCWDGTSVEQNNVVKQPSGTYVYTLQVKSICAENKDLFEKGTIVLIR